MLIRKMFPTSLALSAALLLALAGRASAQPAEDALPPTDESAPVRYAADDAPPIDAPPGRAGPRDGSGERRGPAARERVQRDGVAPGPGRGRFRENFDSTELAPRDGLGPRGRMNGGARGFGPGANGGPGQGFRGAPGDQRRGPDDRANDARPQPPEQFRAQIPDELRDEIRAQLREEIRAELREQMRAEFRARLQGRGPSRGDADSAGPGPRGRRFQMLTPDDQPGPRGGGLNHRQFGPGLGPREPFGGPGAEQRGPQADRREFRGPAGPGAGPGAGRGPSGRPGHGPGGGQHGKPSSGPRANADLDRAPNAVDEFTRPFLRDRAPLQRQFAPRGGPRGDFAPRGQSLGPSRGQFGPGRGPGPRAHVDDEQPGWNPPQHRAGPRGPMMNRDFAPPWRGMQGPGPADRPGPRDGRGPGRNRPQPLSDVHPMNDQPLDSQPINDQPINDQSMAREPGPMDDVQP